MLNIGWAASDFTPERPAMIQGQMHRRIGKEAIDPLTLTALAIEGGQPRDCAIMISLDLPMIPDELLDLVRGKLECLIPEFPSDRLVMMATHTHTSIVIEGQYYEHPGGDVMTAEEGLSLVAEKSSEAAVEAWKGRAPQKFGRAFGHAVVGHNRYAVYADGVAKMYGKTNTDDFRYIGGYEDHSLDMMFTWDAEGKLTGAAIAIPCPSQATEGLSVFSADFWHEVRVELRGRLGDDLFVLPICAPAGDQSPHFLLYGRVEEEMRERCGVTERQAIGLRVADAVERALSCASPMSGENFSFAHRVANLQLPPRKITRADRDIAQELFDQWAKRSGETESWWPKGQMEVIEIFEGKREPKSASAEIHVIRIGDAVFATNPFELFIDYGLQIKARSAAAQTIQAQIAGPGFYLPTERAIRLGGYGAIPAVSVGGPEAGQMIVEETLKIIRQLWGEN